MKPMKIVTTDSPERLPDYERWLAKIMAHPERRLTVRQPRYLTGLYILQSLARTEAVCLEARQRLKLD